MVGADMELMDRMTCTGRLIVNNERESKDMVGAADDGWAVSVPSKCSSGGMIEVIHSSFEYRSS
jgi:hypothetical protein